MSLLIKNGRVITASDDYVADVFVEGERVTHIGPGLSVKAERTIDATGKLVIPGGIDPHTHMDMPFGGTKSSDDFDTGTVAAAFGGTTTIIDYAIQSRGKSALEGLDTWRKKADGKATIDYAFHMIVTDMPDERIAELRRLADDGVTSCKMFMAYPGVLYADDGALYRAFRHAGEDGARVCMHAENGIVIDEIIKEAVRDKKLAPIWHGRTRPTRMEAESVHRAIAIAEMAHASLFIVHLSSADALEEIKRARARGIDVEAETCPQYLFLDESYYLREGCGGFEGAKWVMSPPLRDKSNQEPLWQGLALKHLSAVATDHCPFFFNGGWQPGDPPPARPGKELGREGFTKIPNGAPGVENRMALMYQGGVVEGRFSLNRFVEVTSTAAAKLFGMFPKKGTIAVGSDADIVIFDPNRTETISVDNARTHHMQVDYSAFEGITVKGYPDTVISRGRVIVDHGSQKTKGGGQFIKRARVGQLLR
ncbi:MAG: dihydropyrimidinase [Deltaproteobacteria bacterium RBG_16_71_12]|nr:MAG: dihydropyrimidinase [Deltaproteobacteria bacterium RBG_16_71_12]